MRGEQVKRHPGQSMKPLKLLVPLQSGTEIMGHYPNVSLDLLSNWTNGPINGWPADNSTSKSKQHNPNSPKDDGKIKQNGQIFQVEQIEFELSKSVLQTCCVGVLDLRPACYARPYRMALVVKRNLFSQLLDEIRAFGPGAYETHFPSNHIQKLGEFVEPVLSEESSNASYTRVVILSPLSAFITLGVHPHGTKLQQFEYFACVAHAFLPVKHRPLRIQADGDRGQSYYR